MLWKEALICRLLGCLVGNVASANLEAEVVAEASPLKGLDIGIIYLSRLAWPGR